MHSRRLQTALTKFIRSAATHLQAEVDSGAEVGFELGSKGGRRGRGGPQLYTYHALTGQFIAERESELEGLAGHTEALKLLEGFDGLDRYLTTVSAPAAPSHPARAGKGQARTRAAIRALLADVFDEQTDFEVHPERLSAALERLERSELASTSEVALVATLHGLTISSPELSLAKGLTIAHPETLQDMPAAVGSVGEDERGGDHLVVALTIRDQEGALDRRPALAMRSRRAVRCSRTCCGRCGCSATAAWHSARWRGHGWVTARGIRWRCGPADGPTGCWW